MEYSKMNEVDLFGHEIRITESELPYNQLSKYKKFQKFYNYKKAETKNCCGNCSHHYGGGYNGKKYHKCLLMGISHSISTDIRVGFVCDRYNPKGTEE